MSTYVFVHVNKCGGKSIHTALKKLCLEKRVPYEEMHGNHLRPVHIKKPYNYILFVRDPIMRFVSSFYYYRQRTGFPKGTPHDLNEFITLLKTNHSFRIICEKTNLHFHYSLDKYVVNSVVASMVPWYFIGTTESINESFKELQEKMFGKDHHPVTLDNYNFTIKGQEPMTEENIRYLREEYLKNSYEILAALAQSEYCSAKVKHIINGYFTRTAYLVC